MLINGLPKRASDQISLGAVESTSSGPKAESHHRELGGSWILNRFYWLGRLSRTGPIKNETIASNSYKNRLRYKIFVELALISDLPAFLHAKERILEWISRSTQEPLNGNPEFDHAKRRTSFLGLTWLAFWIFSTPGVSYKCISSGQSVLASQSSVSR